MGLNDDTKKFTHAENVFDKIGLNMLNPIRLLRMGKKMKGGVNNSRNSKLYCKIKSSLEIINLPVKVFIDDDINRLILLRIQSNNHANSLVSNINYVTLSPKFIESMIKKNFTIIERLIYKDIYLVEAAVAYIELFITNLVAHPKKDKIFELMLQTLNHPMYITKQYQLDKEYRMEELLKYLDEIVFTTKNGTINSSKYLFVDEFSDKRSQKILMIYAKVIMQEFITTLFPNTIYIK